MTHSGDLGLKELRREQRVVSQDYRDKISRKKTF